MGDIGGRGAVEPDILEVFSNLIQPPWFFEFSLLCFLFAVTLKNAAELLEFSAMYNAEQLKLSCLQFIGLNMAALLEAR